MELDLKYYHDITGTDNEVRYNVQGYCIPLIIFVEYFVSRILHSYYVII